MITHYAHQAIPEDELFYRPDKPAPVRSSAFYAILDRIAQATEWNDLLTILNGVDSHSKAFSFSLEEIGLINANAVLRSLKIPEDPTEIYADEQMALRKAMREKASVAG